MYLKPKEGLSVPDLERRDMLPAAGREVTPSTYWHRRIVDGDVEEAGAPPPVEEPAPSQALAARDDDTTA